MHRAARVLAVFVLFAATFARAQDAGWTVSVLTFGPGPAIEERYGHIAIRLRNERVDVAYDWGNFDFNDPDFLSRFLRGDMRYWMEGKDAPLMIEIYGSREGRTVIEQTLNFSPEQTKRLIDAIVAQDDDAHRHYHYDYFKDNCATRIRDLIDDATAGGLQATKRKPTGRTYRSENRRLVPGGIDNVALLALIDLAMGPRNDAPLSAWDEMFLPTAVADELDEAKTATGEPLVRERRVLFQASDPLKIEPTTPSQPARWWVPISIVGAALILVGGWTMRVIGSGWSLFAGVGGVCLLSMIAFTAHWPVAWNANLLQFTPLSLAVAWYLLRGKSIRALKLQAVVVGLSLVGALVTISHLTRQANAPAIVLAVPLHLATYLGARRWSRAILETNLDPKLGTKLDSKLTEGQT